MPNYLSEDSIRTAISHICRFGDTDIFPHLLELLFVSECRDDVVEIVKNIDVGSFAPSHSVEALAPKSRYGFRIANQLMLKDTLVLTSAVIEIAEDLERLKAADDEFGPFAYRFQNSGDGSLFEGERTFRHWIDWQLKYAEENEFDKVVFTDIADFYQRIYFHRIENVLRSASANKPVARLIENIIKKIRSKQSYGIPVGGTASRLIAEAVLSDFDRTMESEEYAFSRFVDDMRIYVLDGESPYRALSLAAETLISEGLTLNAQKTKVFSKREYIDYLEAEGVDTFDEATNDALLMLSRSIYFDEEEPSEDDLSALRSINLLELLEAQISSDTWDFGKIRSIFRALRLTENPNCVDFIVENIELLLPFVKDIVLLFDTLYQNEIVEEIAITDVVLECLSSGAGHSVQVIRAWLIELFIRGIVPISVKRLNEVQRLSELDGRQIVLAHAAVSDVAYFRRNKTRFDQFSKFEQSALILGATCLPKDEFETWLAATKAGMHGKENELNQRFCDWAKTKHGQFESVTSDLANVSLSFDVSW